VVDVAGVAGRGPGGEAAFDLAGRAAAEHLDQDRVQGQQPRAGFGAEVGVEHRGRERPGNRVRDLVAGHAEAP
jgi:hypothetical protein